MLYILLTIVHILVCAFLILVVLLQSGKAGDLASAFGGMGSQTAFGPRAGATALSQATTAAAVIFMITSIGLAVLTNERSGGSKSVLENAVQSAPANPAPAAQTPAAPAPNQSQPGAVTAPIQEQTPATPAPAPSTPEPKKQ